MTSLVLNNWAQIAKFTFTCTKKYPIYQSTETDRPEETV